jgi:hypothetical protein
MAIGRVQSVKISTHAAERRRPRPRSASGRYAWDSWLRATANLQAFFQAFPNFGLFSPRISKDSFGGFVGFQMVAMDKNRIVTP